MEEGAPIRFDGSPVSLVAAASGDDFPAGLYRIRVASDTARERGQFETAAVAVDTDPIMRLHLPRTTPPGEYRGQILVGDRERPVVIHVQAEIFFRIMPERLIFTGKAEDHVRFELTFLNLGNVPLEIADVYAFGVFDVGGTERAIGRMAQAEDGHDPGRRIDVFAGAVADEHGGVVRVKVESGSGSLAPGATQDVAITIRVPERVKSGHTYWGTWPMYNNRYYVKITGT
jgi:hypothetical protein